MTWHLGAVVCRPKSLPQTRYPLSFRSCTIRAYSWLGDHGEGHRLHATRGEEDMLREQDAKVRRLLQEAAKPLSKIEDVMYQLKAKQKAQRREFELKMEQHQKKEPKPEDYGLPPGWRPPGGMGAFTSMGEWKKSS